MKITSQHLEILKNFNHINEKFCYSGNFMINIQNPRNKIWASVEVLDFFPVPVDFYDWKKAFKFINEESDITLEKSHLIIKNGNSCIKLSLANHTLVENSTFASLPNDIMHEPIISFNLPYKDYQDLIKYSNAIDCDMLKIIDVDDKTYLIKAWKKGNMAEDSYHQEIKIDHNCMKGEYALFLDSLTLVKASDYKFTFYIKETKISRFPILRVEAFMENNVTVRYAIACCETAKEI